MEKKSKRESDKPDKETNERIYSGKEKMFYNAE